MEGSSVCQLIPAVVGPTDPTLTVVIAYADRLETTEHRIYVRVLGVNDDPQAWDDHFEFREWRPEYSLAVLRNDTSSPDPYEKLTIIEVGETLGNGTVEITDDGRQLITMRSPHDRRGSQVLLWDLAKRG